jgi:hypothetical protein
MIKETREVGKGWRRASWGLARWKSKRGHERILEGPKGIETAHPSELEC